MPTEFGSMQQAVAEVDALRDMLNGLVEAVLEAQWNAADPYDEDTDILVCGPNWRRLKKRAESARSALEGEQPE